MASRCTGSDTGVKGIEFDPSDAGHLSEEAEHKLEFFFSKLRQFRDNLPVTMHAKLPDSQLRELAKSLLDGTVFEIVKELEDIQQLTERSLLNKRMRVVSSHKTRRVELVKQHKAELATNQHKAHNLPLLKARHETERHNLEQKLLEEMHSTDQKIILDLDQIVTEQQSTMHQAAVPFFVVTNNPEEIQVQVHILSFIQRLGTQTS